MIGLDTNLLVRYIVQDDPAQARIATMLLERHCSVENPGRVDTIVLCELVWVLESAYEYNRETVARVLYRLLATTELAVEEPELAWAALQAFETGGADFTDYLIGLRNKARGCDSTYTLDKRAAKSPWHSLSK